MQVSLMVTCLGDALFPDVGNEGNRAGVATNLPSFLVKVGTRLPPGVRPLADFPPGCSIELARGRNWREFIPPWLFMVGGEVGKGRLLVLADRRAFGGNVAGMGRRVAHVTPS